MANDANKVISGIPAVAGGVLAGPRGTTLPTTAVATPNVALKAMGYISDSGLERSEDRSTSDILEWGGKLVKRKQTGFAVELTFAFLEYLNADAAKTVYGDTAVTVTPADAAHGTQIAIAVNGDESPHLSWVFDMADGAAKIRLAVPDGQITSTDTIGYTRDGAALRTVTVTAYPDASGNFLYEYTDDGVLAP